MPLSVPAAFGVLVLLGLVVSLVLLSRRLHRKAWLAKGVYESAVHELQAAKKLAPEHAVLQAHKRFVYTLETLLPGQKHNAAKTIARLAPRLPNTQAVWRAHRLRNRIAHEPEIVVTEKQAQQAIDAFTKALHTLLHKKDR